MIGTPIHRLRYRWSLRRPAPAWKRAVVRRRYGSRDIIVSLTTFNPAEWTIGPWTVDTDPSTSETGDGMEAR